LPSKSKASNELASLIARHGLEPFLRSTRTLVALLDSRGRPVRSNPAFGALRKSLPKAKTFADLVRPSSRTEYERSFESRGRAPRAVQLQLDLGPEGGGGRYDCLFVPLPDGRRLIFAERLPGAADLPEKYRRLMESHEQLRTKMAAAERDLSNRRTELQAVLVQAREVSHTDALTGLPNRRQIMADLQRQATFAETYDAPFTVSIVDIDHFKQVNDSYGHSNGDDVLKFVAMQLREHIREPDVIGRHGGEEFLVILPNGSLKAAAEQAERLCRQIRSTPIISGNHAIQVTISIGIAQYKLGDDDWRKLLARADQALYQAKGGGRDQWAIVEA
jgi:diguanylate cyclase (GGDEF)-like protein